MSRLAHNSTIKKPLKDCVTSDFRCEVLHVVVTQACTLPNVSVQGHKQVQMCQATHEYLCYN